jgi:RNA polymerase-binding transcription factor DksA
MTFRFDEALTRRLRRGLLDRGMVLATLLSEAMAKPGAVSEGRLTALGIGGKPGMTLREKLRWALDHVENRRKLLDARDDAYGRCEVCNADLGELALGEMPWADRCRAHPD